MNAGKRISARDLSIIGIGIFVGVLLNAATFVGPFLEKLFQTFGDLSTRVLSEGICIAIGLGVSIAGARLLGVVFRKGVGQ